MSIYSRALTATEMQAIYNAGAAGKCEAPVPPVILTQPQSQAAFVGANVTINVVATGSIPLSFQWRLNGTNLVEGTNASLTFNNVQPGNAGNYSVVVSNLAGSVVSSNAVLAVLPQGSCVAPPDGIVAWWPGETNANDLAGGNTGILVNGVSFGPGEVGKCFLFDGVNDQVLVPASADLNVRSFTVEAWINPADIQTKRPIIEYAAPTGRAGVHLWLSVAPTGASSSPGTLFANIRDISNISHIIASLPNLIQANQWIHVALAYDRISGDARLFINGVTVAATNLGSFMPQTPLPLNIGYRPPASLDGGASTPFVGGIDEVSIYNRALSGAEVQAIYYAGAAGKCFPVLNDGIPGSWRQYYFGPEYANDPRVPAIADPDGDGANNYQEFMADTNPLDSQSFVLSPLLAIAPSEPLFTNSVNVALVSPVINGVIRYTMDNSAPSPASAIYQAAIRLYEMTTIKAQVFVNGFPVSEVVTATFTRIYAANDGIPDSWREQYFGPNFRTDPRVASQADPDGDGSDNAHEYVAGTHPLDPSSRLAVAIRFLPLITWDSLTNRSYRVVRRDSVRATNTVALTPFIRATNTVSSFIDFDAPSLNAFYLIEIEP